MYIISKDHMTYKTYLKNNEGIIVRCSKRVAIVALGKGTSWCISDPRETYWGTYVRSDDDQQYILYDFNYPLTSKFHIIGVTNQNGNLSHAHANGNDPLNMNTHIGVRSTNLLYSASQQNRNGSPQHFNLQQLVYKPISHDCLV